VIQYFFLYHKSVKSDALNKNIKLFTILLLMSELLTRWMPLVEQELLTLLEHQSSPPVFSGVHVTRSLVLCVMYCRSLLVLLSLFVCPLRCLSFDLQILITPLVSLNSSSIQKKQRAKEMKKTQIPLQE